MICKRTRALTSITIYSEPEMPASHIPFQLVPKLQQECNRLTSHSQSFYVRAKDSWPSLLLRHSFQPCSLDAKKGTDCNAIQRPTSSDMDNTDRAETVQSWLTKQKSHEIFRSTASTVDIPSRWDPRAKQSRTVALLAALRAAALFEPLPSCRQKEKPAHNVYWFFLVQ